MLDERSLRRLPLVDVHRQLDPGTIELEVVHGVADLHHEFRLTLRVRAEVDLAHLEEVVRALRRGERVLLLGAQQLVESARALRVALLAEGVVGLAVDEREHAELALGEHCEGFVAVVDLDEAAVLTSDLTELLARRSGRAVGARRVDGGALGRNGVALSESALDAPVLKLHLHGKAPLGLTFSVVRGDGVTKSAVLLGRKIELLAVVELVPKVGHELLEADVPVAVDHAAVEGSALDFGHLLRKRVPHREGLRVVEPRGTRPPFREAGVEDLHAEVEHVRAADVVFVARELEGLLERRRGEREELAIPIRRRRFVRLHARRTESGEQRVLVLDDLRVVERARRLDRVVEDLAVRVRRVEVVRAHELAVVLLRLQGGRNRRCEVCGLRGTAARTLNSLQPSSDGGLHASNALEDPLQEGCELRVARMSHGVDARRVLREDVHAESDLMYADDVSLSELWQSNSWVV